MLNNPRLKRLPSSTPLPASERAQTSRPLRLRSMAFVVGILSAVALHLLLFLGPFGHWILLHERIIAHRLVGASTSEADSCVVVVDVGRWPPRDMGRLHQALITLVDQTQPKVLVLDILSAPGFGLGNAILEHYDSGPAPRPPYPLVDADFPVLMAAELEWRKLPNRGWTPVGVVKPVQMLESLAVGVFDLGPPQPLNEAEPLLAVTQVFPDSSGVAWGVGLGLAAAQLFADSQSKQGPNRGEWSRNAVGMDDCMVDGRTIDLDAGKLWMHRTPEVDSFPCIPLTALSHHPLEDSVRRQIQGKVVVVGLVGSNSRVDTHLTAAGWTRGALLHAAQIQQLINGPSFTPWSGPASAMLALCFLLLAAVLSQRCAKLHTALAGSLLLGLLGTAAALLCFVEAWSLVPPVRPLCGALLGFTGAAGARLWSLRAELQRFRGLPTPTWREDPIAELFRRCHIQRLIANELVRSRTWSDARDPAFGLQEKEQRVFKISERVQRRIAGLEWELGTPRGVKDVVEILYQSLYEGSGALKRIPSELKGRASPIFIIKQLRNYFDHSYDLHPQARRSLDAAFASWSGGYLADLQTGTHAQLLRVQVRLLEESNAWLTALQDRLRRELRSVYIIAPQRTWSASRVCFHWLWEAEASGWRLEIQDAGGKRLFAREVDGRLRSWEAPLELEAGSYSARFTLLAGGSDGPSFSSAFRIPEDTVRLSDLTPSTLELDESASGRHDRNKPEAPSDVGGLRRKLERLHTAHERGQQLLETAVFFSEAAVELFRAREVLPSEAVNESLERALLALQVPGEVVLRVMLRRAGGRLSARLAGES